MDINQTGNRIRNNVPVIRRHFFTISLLGFGLGFSYWNTVSIEWATFLTNLLIAMAVDWVKQYMDFSRWPRNPYQRHLLREEQFMSPHPQWWDSRCAGTATHYLNHMGDHLR